MKEKWNLTGTLIIDFSGTWGVAEANPTSGVDLLVRQVPMVQEIRNQYTVKPRYWLPASTLKGTFRSVAMKFDKNSCNTAHIRFKDCSGSKPCMVCSLFGTDPYQPSRIYFSSVMLDPMKHKVNKLAHVGIDRKKQSNTEQALFSELRLGPGKLPIEFSAVHLSKDELEFVKNCLGIWGKFGLGKSHTPFNLHGIEKLDEQKRRTSL